MEEDDCTQAYMWIEALTRGKKHVCLGSGIGYDHRRVLAEIGRYKNKADLRVMFEQTFTGSRFSIDQVVSTAVHVIKLEHVRSVIFSGEDFREYDISELVDTILDSSTLEWIRFVACRFTAANKNKILEVGVVDEEQTAESYELITIDVSKIQWNRTARSIPADLGGVAHAVHAWMKLQRS